MNLKEELIEVLDYYGDRDPALIIEVPTIIYPCPRPKIARTRYGQSIAIYPKEYVENKKLIADYTELAIKDQNYKPPESVLVLVKYYGVEQIGPRSSRDGDNMLKTVFDAISTGGVFTSDSLGKAPFALFRWIPESIDNKTQILIYETHKIEHQKIRAINRKKQRREKEGIQQ